MSAGRRWSTRVGVAVLAVLVAGAGFNAPAALGQEPGPQPPGPGDERQLDQEDRKLIEQAEDAGRSKVTLLVAAQRGRSDDAAGQLRSIGGEVTSTDKRLDYLKVSVPIEEAERAPKLRSVYAVDVDGLIHREEPVPTGVTDPIPQDPPDAKTPRVNPYLPTGDTGAAQFTNRHRKWDGRGTTIAVLDTGVDLDHPALAKTSTGERKVVDWYNANGPVSGDGTWVDMSFGTYSGTFTASGREWTAPEGSFHFGLFSETAGDLGTPSSETGGDLNRDGDRADSWGVLRDTFTDEVWVDVDGDGDFTNETMMIDYALRPDVGHFGKDDPDTGVVERVPFVVQTDHEGYVNIGIAGAAHGSHVAGIAAGNDLFGGRLDGAAPGAKLMSIKVCLSTPSCTAAGLIDGVAYAAKHGADVVNISIGGLPALNDGNNARAALYNRIIATYNTQLFISAGNSGAGANSVGDPAVATDAVAVGSYITDDTWLSNYGSESPRAESMHPFSSRGPAEDGAFKPQLVAPGAAVSAIPRWQEPNPVPGTYDLPVGYGMFNGTSMAAPQATGAAALLVGAYKARHGERPQVRALRTAMTSSARFVEGIEANAQGAGLIDTSGALRALRGGAQHEVTTSVPVNTVLADQLENPGTGVGIHDREGVVMGKAYTRTYTLTRTTGPARPVHYRVSWLGDTDVFSSARRVALPLNRPVTFDVRIDPAAAGTHSAILRLDDRRTPGIDVQTMNTVFAPHEFNEGNAFQVKASGTIQRNQATSVFVRVPEGAGALSVNMAAGGQAEGAGQVRFLRYDPTGVPVDSTSSLNCFNPDAGGGCQGGSPTSRSVTDPMPGVWELIVEARRTSDTGEAPWSLTATVQGTAITPDPDVIAEATIGEPVAREYDAVNTLGEFTGRLHGGALDSARVERPSIADGGSQAYEVTVPEGSSALTATIGSPSDAGADLDVFVYDCTSGSCRLAAFDADGDSEESVTIADPAAGAWRVEVDGYAVPSGTTEFDYLDSFAAPGLGSIEVTDADAPRPSGATWTVPATVTAEGQPGEGRVLRGLVTARTEDDRRVGSATVVVESVS